MRVAVLLCVLASVLAVVRLWPQEPILARYPASLALYSANGELLRLTIAADGAYRLPVKLADVSPRFIDAVLLHEDRHFWIHPGVNVWALARGAVRTFVIRDRRLGGSTITMQLARKLYGVDSNRIPGKLLQIARAVQLEAQYSKHDILEAYFNLAPYGGNVQGIGAASLIYFHKRAHDLALPEALALAVVPQNPSRRVPGSNNTLLEAARQLMFAEWRAAHRVTPSDTSMVALPLQAYTGRDLPFRAPHATQALIDVARGAGAEITTTVDLRLQRLLESQLHSYVERQRRFGITNASAMLVDSRDMHVLASVGSANFFDSAIAGQVDGTRAKRSPGSTLKPFIYALAIEQGLVHPMTVLKDTPQAFGAVSPENFDGEFTGPITVQDALIRSRNIPAVYVGMKLNRPSFYDFLKTAGVSRLASTDQYGLAIYLGGAELTMRELVTLYGALANNGELRPLVDRLDVDASAAAARVLTRESTFIVLDMLAHNPRPAQAFMSGAVVDNGPVHWKTGTSTGFRDAWAVGIFDHYVLAVWLGNFDNHPNPALVGVQVAAPLFFQMIDAVRATAPRRGAQRSTDSPQTAGTPNNERDDVDRRAPPSGVRRIEVCADSGDLPNQWCPRRVRTWYLPGVSPIRISTLHRQLMIDTRTGKQACAPFDPLFVRAEVHEFWSSDMLDLFARAGMPRRVPPPLDSRCTNGAAAGAALAAGRDPEITSPLNGVSYVMRDIAAAPIPLRATTEADVGELFWFVDGAFIGRTKRGVTLEWQPNRPGKFFLRVVDDSGRAAGREVRLVSGDT